MDIQEREQDLDCPLITETAKEESKNRRNEILVEVKKLLMGMGSALGTLCGQSYGAKQYHMLGIHMQRAMLVLLLASVPFACIWANAGYTLVFLGQDPEIAAEAGSYARYMIPSIFAYALLQCHIRFLQAQNNVLPMMFSAGITTLLHLFSCWILIFKSGLGNKGAALANAISY
ncbi:protein DETOXIFICATION 16-like [Nicotiana tabacum]|uniref:Protein DETOXIFICATION 16-like n=1 Tax=Nicotiana tabacum TaxID=4097 RepID=A0AC58T903_TOBAC